MKRKKGFTLIEVLSIILILGVLAAISVPIVRNIIEDNRRKSFEASLDGVVRAVELYVASGAIINDIEFNYNDETIKSENNNFVSGTIKYENSEITIVDFSDGDYCANGTKGNYTIDDGACKIIETPNSCFVFDSTAKTITDYKYDEITCLGNVTIPSTINDVIVENIGDNAFRSKNLESVIIPNTILNIGKYAFALNNLSSVVLPSNLTMLSDGIFYRNQLKSITIPSNIISIGYEAFENNFLSTLTIPEGVTTIGVDAFEDNLLKSVNLANTVTSFGREAFKSNLIESIDIPSSTTSIGSNAFVHNKIANLTIPNSVTNIVGGAFNDNQLPDDQAFIYVRNADGSIDTTALVSYGGAKRENVIIPDNVKAIGGQTFYSLGLKSITIPSSITYIHGGAFNNNKLSDDQAFIYYRNGNGSIDDTKIVSYGGEKRYDIIIPSQVKTIGESAFSGNSIKSIDIPNTITNIEARAFNINELSDDQAFIYARNEDGTIDNTRLVSYGGAKLNGVEIPSTVTTIGEEAFRSVGLVSITIPSNVTTIETDAFIYNDGVTININRSNNKISGSPWGAVNATVNWIGSN